MADLLGSIVLIVVVRHELVVEPFLRRFLLYSLPISVAVAVALPRIDVTVLAAGLGVALMGTGIYLAIRRELGVWDGATLHRRAVPAGLAAGLLSGLYGMAAPAVVVYLAHAGPDTGRFRARATIIAIVFSSARVLALVAIGAIGAERLMTFGLTAPVVLLGLGVGVWLHPRVGQRAFRATLGVTVLLAGSLLVLRTALG